jgi:hypothetical protein
MKCSATYSDAANIRTLFCRCACCAADVIQSGAYLLYDGALGTGGMLTVAEETLRALASKRGKQVTTHLYGQEINPETYAVCKADMILKGEGESANHIVGGAEWSTLSHDAFPAQEFDFMLSNPPYGKSWKKDLETMGGKDAMRDQRFKVMHNDEELSLVTRSSDGQLLFLANMASKMNHQTPLGSRIAEVHNGSSLFTGDAGQGESNISRWLIDNDWVEAIVAMPLNLFYNTGIATYIWVLSNRKAAQRRGKVQLIDATQWFKPLRKNLGKKNCELSQDDIQRICDTYLPFKETEHSKVFANADFGYWKVTVERPLRLHSQLTPKAIESLRFASGDEDLRAELHDRLGEPLFADFARVGPSWKSSSASRAATNRKATTPRPRRACRKRKRRSSSIRRRGNATPSSPKSLMPCAPILATTCSRTTISSAIAWTTPSTLVASSCLPRTENSSFVPSVGASRVPRPSLLRFTNQVRPSQISYMVFTRPTWAAKSVS